MDDKTAARMRERILEAAMQQGVEGVVINLSLLEMIDSYLARLITDTARMIKLMGAEVCLAGLQPMVALTIVEMGLDLGYLPCELDVDSALAHIKKLRLRGSGKK